MARPAPRRYLANGEIRFERFSAANLKGCMSLMGREREFAGGNSGHVRDCQYQAWAFHLLSVGSPPKTGR